MSGTGRINVKVDPPDPKEKEKAKEMGGFGLQGEKISTLWFSWRFHSDDAVLPLHVVEVELVPQGVKGEGESGDDATVLANKLKKAIKEKMTKPQGPRNPHPLTQAEVEKITIEEQGLIAGSLPGRPTFMAVSIDDIDEIDCACCEPGGQVKITIDGLDVGRRDGVKVVDLELNQKNALRDDKVCPVMEPADVIPKGLIQDFGSPVIPFRELDILASAGPGPQSPTSGVARSAVGIVGQMPVRLLTEQATRAVLALLRFGVFRLHFGLPDTRLAVPEVTVIWRIIDSSPELQLAHIRDALVAARVRVDLDGGRLTILCLEDGNLPLRRFSFTTNLVGRGFPWHIAFGLWVPPGRHAVPEMKAGYQVTEVTKRFGSNKFEVRESSVVQVAPPERDDPLSNPSSRLGPVKENQGQYVLPHSALPQHPREVE